MFSTVALILALLFAYLNVSHSLARADREVIQAKWDELATVYRQRGQSGVKEFLGSEENRTRSAPFLVGLVAEDGGLLFLKPVFAQGAKFDLAAVTEHLRQSRGARGWYALAAVNGDEDRLDVLSDRVGANVSLQVGRSSEDREGMLENIALAFTTASGVMILLSAGLGFWYARRALLPIHALTHTIQDIEREGLGHRVSVPTTQDELRLLAETFNRLMAKIERLVRAMKESVDNVAHDIRTPLTRIRARAEEALVNGEPGQALAALAECTESVSEISALVDQVLDISEAEAGVMKLRREPCAVEPLLREVIDVYEHVAEEKRISTELGCSPGLEWPLDRGRIKQVIANLLDNALKYSPAGSRVFVSARVEGASLRIRVEDEGAGIPPEDLPRIWDRLFRGDRSRSTPGLGLGLSIVRSIVHAHGGTVVAERAPVRGTRIEVSLPAHITKL